MVTKNFAHNSVTLNSDIITPASSLHSSAGQRRENVTKASWVEIRTVRDHSPHSVKTGSTWGYSLNLLPIKSEQDKEK